MLGDKVLLLPNDLFLLHVAYDLQKGECDQRFGIVNSIHAVRQGQHFSMVVYIVGTVRQPAGTEPSLVLTQTSEVRRRRHAANIQHALAAALLDSGQPVL